MSTPWEYPFHPHAKQELALKATAREMLYGGAVYGGKSEVLLAACIDMCMLVAGSKALLVRRTTGELAELKDRLRKRIPKQVAVLNKSENTYYFANGSMLIMRFLDSEEDASKVQGFEVQLACFDELTHYDKSWYAEVVSRLRATGPVKEQMDRLGMAPRALSASNPGGRGHSWVKERFVDPAPMGEEFIGDDGTRRMFIQATIYDNPYADVEDYVTNSLGALDPERKRALLEGDWGIPAGVRFPQFRERIHVIKPEEFPIPVVGAVRVVGVDYGIDDPMAAVWMAKVGDTIVVYRDHVVNGLAASQQAAKVRELEEDAERVHSDVTVALDPNAWARNAAFGGVKLGPGSDEAPLGSIAHYFKESLGDRVVKGWNPRIQGWAIFDELFVEQDTGMVDDEGNPVKLPRILVYDTCRNLIKFFQSAPRDKRNPQDVQKSPKYKDDHVGDAARYAVAEILGRQYASPPTGHERMALDAARTTVTGDLGTRGF